jgi:hypothetical protein
VVEEFGYAWYPAPGVMISQAVRRHATAAMAIRFQDLVDAVLLHDAQAIHRLGGITVINDWRLIESYDSEARKIIQDRMKRRPKGYLKATILAVPSATPLLRMAVQAANLLAALTSGGRVELTDDLELTLSILGLGPPAPGEAFPGLR